MSMSFRFAFRKSSLQHYFHTKHIYRNTHPENSVFMCKVADKVVTFRPTCHRAHLRKHILRSYVRLATCFVTHMYASKLPMLLRNVRDLSGVVIRKIYCWLRATSCSCHVFYASSLKLLDIARTLTLSPRDRGQILCSIWTIVLFN